jgi:RNA polymerase sigma-70 factor, ECF subfamily
MADLPNSRNQHVVEPGGLPAADGLDKAALLRKDQKAFEELVRQESPRLFRLLLRMLNDPDEAQSVLQETFLQAYQHLETFRGESKLTTWLYGIGINQARVALRKRRRLEPMSDEDIERLQPTFRGGVMYTDTPQAWNPERHAELADTKQLVRDAIDQLPEQYRTVILLRDIEELSTEEVAQVLEISAGAVRVRLHRARQALRALLDRYFHD